MQQRLSNKVAIVTGAGSGFGAGIAHRFCEQGAQVIVADINETAGRRVAQSIAANGGRAEFIYCDVSLDADVKQLVSAALEAFGTVDICVNNAGTTHRNQPMLDVAEAEFDRLYAVNVKSLYLTARHLVPIFRSQGGGCFVQIASTGGVRPRPGLTWYNGTKGAVIATSRSMAVELGPDRIRVNVINPALGETPLLSEFMGGSDTPQNRARFLATIPLGRFARPDDVANAAVFLASDEAAFITGACLEVDGGRCV